MQLSNLPGRILAAFAVSGSKRTIPVASQIGVTPGAASFTDGFPPLTFTPLASGGIPPAGQDFNGILNAITLIQQWQSAGGSFAYDPAWSTANNGYPKGAILSRADGTGFWFNTADNNTADPDGATPTGWVPEWQYGITAIAGLTNANVTLTSLQYGRRIITLAGTLTGNVQIIFPALAAGQWLVVNNTTGAFTVTAKTAAGTGVVVAPAGQLAIWSDGTNIQGPFTQSGIVGQTRNVRASQVTPGVALTITADEVVLKSALGGPSVVLSAFNQTVSIAVSGVGGMDVGSAPNPGWIAVYAICNPVTGARALLARDATGAAQPEIYGGANMPAGYTHSALLAVLPTGGNIPRLELIGRRLYYFTSAYNGPGFATLTLLSIAGSVPKNAIRWFGNGAISAATTGAHVVDVAGQSTGAGAPGYERVQSYATATTTCGGTFTDIPLFTQQTTWFNNSTGGNVLSLNVYGYDF